MQGLAVFLAGVTMILQVVISASSQFDATTPEEVEEALAIWLSRLTIDDILRIRAQIFSGIFLMHAAVFI